MTPPRKDDECVDCIHHEAIEQGQEQHCRQIDALFTLVRAKLSSSTFFALLGLFVGIFGSLLGVMWRQEGAQNDHQDAELKDLTKKVDTKLEDIMTRITGIQVQLAGMNHGKEIEHAGK